MYIFRYYDRPNVSQCFENEFIPLTFLREKTSYLILLMIYNVKYRKYFLPTGDREEINLRLQCKWGLDGSSGQSSYRQAGTSDPTRDQQVFVTSLVPLRMTCDDDDSSIVWKPNVLIDAFLSTDETRVLQRDSKRWQSRKRVLAGSNRDTWKVMTSACRDCESLSSPKCT